MSKILKLKGNEVTGATSLGAANSLSGATLVKVYHTAAVTVTVTDSANTQIGNTTLEAGTHFIAKAPTDKIFTTAGLFTSVGYAD